MKKLIGCGLILLIACSAFTEPSVKAVLNLKAEVQAARARAEGVDSIILVLKDDVPRKKSGASALSFSQVELPQAVLKNPTAAKKSAGRGRRPARLKNLHTAKLKKGADLVMALRELNDSPYVEYAEPNYRVQPFALPNDPLLDELFTLNNTGQPVYLIDNGSLARTNGLVDADMDWAEAWNESAPGKKFPTNEIIVAVIDTGVDYTHQDITNRMWRNMAEVNGTPGVDDDGNGYTDDVFGYDFNNYDSDPIDREAEGGSHGTHVAGTIAAEADNNYGICGVNPHARIMALKFLGDGGGYTADAIAAIVYAVENGASVINNSWGGGSWQQSLQEAVTFAVTNGVVFVAASGNSDTPTPMYPAAYRGALSVNSFNWNDDRAYYSNYGTHTDVSAHGSDILSLKCSTFSESPGYVVSNDFVVFHGTSMACPAAAGAMSLLTAKYPGLHPYLYERVMETSCDTHMLNSTENAKYPGELGAGRINVNRMLNEPLDTGFIRVNWVEDTTLAILGSSYHIEMEAGLWSNAHSSVTIQATNLTTGISLNNWTHDLGALGAFAETSLSTNTFIATIAVDSTNQYEQLQFNLYADGELLDSKHLQVSFVNGNARRLLVDDFDADGTNEIAAIYYDYTLMYDNLTQLVWIAQSTLNDGNWTFNVCAGDITGDGKKEIISTEHRWVFSSGPPALFAYDFKGYLLDGFPLVMTNTTELSSRRGFGEPTLVDVDEDGVLEMVCNIEYTDERVGALRVYENDGSILWEQKMRYTAAGPAAAADLDGDGFEELIVWNNNNDAQAKPNSSIYLFDGDGTLLREIPLDEGFISTQKELHTKDTAVPVLGDLDGDGDLEILVVANRSDYKDRFFAFHHDGTPVSGWPQELPYEFASKFRPLQLADADGDGDVEVFLQKRIYDNATYYRQVFAFDGDGSALTGYPTASNTLWGTGMALDDVDGDGELDLLTAGLDSSNNPALYGVNLDLAPIAGLNPFVYETADLLGTEDLVLCNMGFNNNRHIVAAMGSDAVIIDTGFALNNLDSAWPADHQNARRTSAVAATGSLTSCTFSANPTIGISNLTAQFTAFVNGFDTATTTFRWDFDHDGSIDQTVFGATTSSWSYSTISNYTVSLTASNAAGQVATQVRSNYIHVLAPVAADFSAVLTNAQAPVTIRFIDESANEPQSWQWDFNNDGTIDSTDQYPEFYYENPGVYTVKLTVSNQFGSGDTVTKTGYIDLTGTGSTAIKYVSPTGLNLPPYKTWEEASTSIQDAIDAAYGGETVLLDDGTYDCGDGDDLRFWIDDSGHFRDGLTVTSRNGPEHTTIRGWGAWPYHGGFYVDAQEDVTISGITFADIEGNGGAGIIFGIYTDGAVISNCVFRNCTDPDDINGGAAVNLWNNGGLISGCLFENNRAARGAVFIRTQTPWGDPPTIATVEDCTFRNNGGSARDAAAAIFIDNRSASWIFPGDVGEHVIRNSAFVGNTGVYHIVYGQPNLLMENCTFADNKTWAADSSVIANLHTETFELEGDNQGPWIVRNTVFDNNDSAAEFRETPAQPINFTYSCLTTPVTGAGNIITNNAGISAIPGDWHLGSDSPCIDAGTSLGWMSGATDLDGNARTINSTPDIGADELLAGCSVSATPAAGLSPVNVSFEATAFSFAGAITNWHWNFGDGSAATSGGSLSNTTHNYTLEGDYVAVLTVFDSAGGTASNGALIHVDDTGPVAESASAVSSTAVRVIFDEPVDETSATLTANYSFDTVSITGATRSDDDEVTLFVTTMSDLSTNTLTVSNVQDIYGNPMVGSNVLSFIYRDPLADQRVLFDFGFIATTNLGWNNVVNANANSTLSNVVNATGAGTEMDLKILSTGFAGYNSSTGESATNILYPTSAQRDVFNHNKTTPRLIRLSDLDVSNRYDLVFFASMDYAGDYATRYAAAGRTTDVLQTHLNISNTVELLEVEPNASGQIDIDVQRVGAAANIGVLEVRPREPGLLLSTNGVDAISGIPELTVPEGDDATLYVKLLGPPPGDVSVFVRHESGDTNLSVSSGSELSFNLTDWDAWKEVHVFATPDADSLDGSATINVSSAAFISRTFQTLEDDDDINLEVSTHTLSVAENSTAQFGVRLTVAPETQYTASVRRVSGDTSLSVQSGDTLLFNSTTWSNWQWVTLAAADDTDWTNGTALFACTGAGGASNEVSAIEADDDFNPAYSIPWNETFENDGTNAGALGALNDQHGWTGNGIVQNGTVHGDSQALEIEKGQAVSHSFLNGTNDVWIRFYAIPTLSEQAPLSIPSNGVAVFYVSNSLDVVAYSGAVAQVVNSPVVSNAWNFFEIHCDYTTDRWDLNINGTNVLTGFAFHSTVPAFSEIQFIENGQVSSYLDDIQIANSLGNDSDDDGLPDSWEEQYWPGDLSHSPGDPAANPDYTIMECYIAGIDPTDENAAFLISDLQPLTSVLSWNSTSGRVYTIYWTSNLLSGFGNPLTNGITGGAFTDSTHGAEAEGFYKIEVELE